MAFNFNDYRMREEAHKDIKYFESKFEARIEDSKEYKQYVRRMPYADWDGNIPFNVEVQTAPMKAIHLTIDNLDRLVREQELMDHLKSDAEFGKKLWRQDSADRAVRESNPAVEKAYRNYLTLLELCRK